MSHQLTIQPLGATVQVGPGQTLLDACLRAGIWLPHACGHGLCGSCKLSVLDGAIDHGEASPFALMDVEREEGKCLACCATAESDLVVAADIDDEPDARVIAVRDFGATVSRIETLTPTIIGVHLQLDGAGIDFQAGQYIQLQVPGVARPRAFSIASAPGTPQHIELNIRRVPGGAATSWLHEQLKPGQRLTLSGPFGRFFVRKSAPADLLFLAGGSGLSSPRSMIIDLLNGGDRRPMTLIHGARSQDELYYRDEFERMAAQYPNLLYLPVLSDAAGDAGWSGLRGYVHDAARQAFAGDFRGLKAYLCGPPPMIEACIRTLMQGRLFERDIHTERFLSAADAATPRSPLFRTL